MDAAVSNESLSANADRIGDSIDSKVARLVSKYLLTLLNTHEGNELSLSAATDKLCGVLQLRQTEKEIIIYAYHYGIVNISEVRTKFKRGYQAYKESRTSLFAKNILQVADKKNELERKNYYLTYKKMIPREKLVKMRFYELTPWAKEHYANFIPEWTGKE